MPSWDEITPYTERAITKPRLNATNALILANILGFVLPALAYFFKAPIESLLWFDAARALHDLWLWQFFTYTFYHSINFWSIFWLAIGCYMLYIMGSELEGEMGWKRFLTFYLGCGVYGAVAHAVYQVLGAHRVAASDFSGPILALFLVWALQRPDRRILFMMVIPMPAIVAALCTIGIVVVLAFAQFHSGWSGFATLGAVGAGYLMYKLEPRLDSLLDALETRRARQRFLRDFETKRQVDAILDKINRQGIGSLSAKERKILKQASRMYAENEHE